MIQSNSIKEEAKILHDFLLTAVNDNSIVNIALKGKDYERNYHFEYGLDRISMGKVDSKSIGLYLSSKKAVREKLDNTVFSAQILMQDLNLAIPSDIYYNEDQKIFLSEENPDFSLSIVIANLAN